VERLVPVKAKSLYELRLAKERARAKKKDEKVK
jgi:hypothetical protein